MKFSILMAAVPAAHATVSYMAAVPQDLMALVDSSSCVLPEDFQVQNFAAQSPDGGQTVDSLAFTFNDDSTGVNTPCHLDASSVPVPGDGRTPRYACDNPVVQFIWQNSQITMIEGVCPDASGAAKYEAAGTAVINVVCDEGAANGTAARRRANARRAVACKADSDDIRARFFSIKPAPSS
ncbi:hypothetical protein CMUS01_06298 [Colletotrichum musicola]|uniref:AA1-like domain-containing protein n=1 Tax=Colletotrichum musicola TaxID=2175873 RepID=A0A8H6KMZ3_9PEZI|nr:hypothetical protein CMUS01_06298 [Colletotrichum musicola]